MSLLSLSPLDGRYESKVDGLRPYFSEFALQKYRLIVELRYLVALGEEGKIKECKRLTATEKKILENLIKKFSETDGKAIKKIEETTNHDVKAIEYFIRRNLEKTTLSGRLSFVHFALTSEDVNNLAYAMMLRDAMKKEILPQLTKVEREIRKRAKSWKKVSLLSRTHGQTATPSTVGKEFWVFAERVQRQIQQLKKQQYLGKLAGATSTFSAQAAAYPDVSWQAFMTKFVRGLGLTPNFAVTQIEPHDFIAEVCDATRRTGVILTDLSRDIWQYISLDYFKLKKKAGEVGSSTMPHKVNPIDFENAEGNFGLAGAMCDFLANKLPISRLQRDLTDSTVLRNLGVAFGHFVLALTSLEKGLGKLELNRGQLLADLKNAPEVLAEAIQTVMRKTGDDKAYEKLKDLTRGEKITLGRIREFVSELKLPKKDKEILLALTPEKYTGLAEKLVK